jgi:hypothetical protein
MSSTKPRRPGAFPSLRFDNSFVRELPGEAETLRAVRGGARCLLVADRAGSRELAADRRLVARSLDLSEFGTWAGQLGDGRAISLGQVLNAAGQRWELQLLTPKSEPQRPSICG